MKRISLLFSLLALTTIFLVPAVSAADYGLIKHHIQWTGSMPTQTHHGLLSPSDFAIEINDDGTVESLSVTLDMNSIDVTDLDEGRMRNKLMTHLRSEDFFHVGTYPTASFTLKRHADNHLDGIITIRGVARPLQLPVTLKPGANHSWILQGTFTFDRQDFGVNYQNGGIFGAAKDKLIRDEVEVAVELTVAQK